MEDCIYCGVLPGITKDHIPPKGFFQEKVPTDAQLITVPCCEECRVRDQSSDEYIRDIIISDYNTEQSSYVREHILPKRDRSFNREPNKIRKLALIMQDGDFDNPNTGKNETGRALKPDYLLFKRFLERMGRGLIYHTYKQGYFDAKFNFNLRAGVTEDVYKFMTEKYPTRNIIEAFRYSVSNEFDNKVRWITIDFYCSMKFLLRFERKGN